MEACLLCTSRELSLLEKLLVDSRTLGNLSLWEENMENYQTATWKGRLLINLLTHHISYKKPHLSQTHTQRYPESDCNDYSSHTCSPYLQGLLFLSTLVLRLCKLHLTWTVLLNTSGILFLELFLFPNSTGRGIISPLEVGKSIS